MKRLHHIVSAACGIAGCSVAAFCAVADAVPQGRFEAGFARVDITPPLGTPISGYFGYRPAEKILDPLEATCVAFSDGTTTALVYTVDNLHVSSDVIARSWEAIARSTGVARYTVFIASTHTHTGAATEKRYYLRGLSGEAEAEAVRLIGLANDLLVSRLADAGRMACEDLAPASIAMARGTCPGISFVRIFKMKDGRTQTNPGVNNPNIAEPFGRPDETLQLVRRDRQLPDASRRDRRAQHIRRLAWLCASLHREDDGGPRAVRALQRGAGRHEPHQRPSHARP